MYSSNGDLCSLSLIVKDSSGNEISFTYDLSTNQITVPYGGTYTFKWYVYGYRLAVSEEGTFTAVDCSESVFDTVEPVVVITGDVVQIPTLSDTLNCPKLL